MNTYAIPMLGVFLLLLCHSKPTLALSEEPWSINVGFEFAHGDYGTDQVTDSYLLPLSLEYSFTEKLSVVLGVPYIYQSNNSTISMGGGRFSMHSSNANATSGMGDQGGAGGSSGMGADLGMGGNGKMGGGSRFEISGESQTGFGDITLVANYTLLPEGNKTPMVTNQLYIKFPTANKEKNLGTGASDYGVGLGLSKGFGNWLVYAEALFITPGSNDLYQPDNYWSWLASTNYPLSNNLYLSVELSGATSPYAEADDVLDLQFKTSYWISQNGNIGGYIAAGLSQSSAEYGVGLYAAISL